MKRVERKAVIVLTLLLVLALNLSSGLCDNRTTIRFEYNYTNPDPKGPVYDANLQKFKKQHPEINLVLQPDPNPDMANIQTKIYTAAAADNLPDVFQYWPGPGMLKNMIDGNKLADLKDYIGNDKEFKGYYRDFHLDNFVRFKKNGPIWGMPCELYYMYLTVNKKLFARAGAAYPKTYEDLQAIIPKFLAKGIIPITMAGKDQDMNVCFWFGMLNRFGTNAEIQKALTTGEVAKCPAFLKSAKVIYDLAGMKAFPSGCTAIGYTEAVTGIFDKGKSAMLYGGCWYAGEISRKTAEDCEIIPLWTFADGKGDPHELLGGIAQEYLVSAKAWKDKNKRAAIDMLLHSIINPQLEAQLVDFAPPLLPAAFTATTNPIIVKADKLAKAASGLTPNYDSIGTQRGNDAMNSLSQALLNRTITPDEAIKKLDAEVKAGLKE